MTFAAWAPQALINAYDEQEDPLVRDALLRLGNHADVEKYWKEFPSPERAVAMLKAAAIFYWQSHELDKPSLYEADIKAMRKHIEELQALIKRTFGVANEKLYKDLTTYKDMLNEDKYKAFYAVPRQQLLWALYRFTKDLYDKPRHNLVAHLASAITDEVLSKEDVQPTYRLLESRKTT
jgi:hypothetical protein